MRLVNKATAAQFASAQYRTVLVPQLAPHDEIVRRWGDARALCVLTFYQRRKLLKLTARSGSLVNLEALLAFKDYCPLLPDILEAAAGAGQLGICQALHQRGCPLPDSALDEAAAGGHRATCEWLLASGCPWRWTAPGRAAAGGHVELVDWLRTCGQPNVVRLISGAAKGCKLDAMQRLYFLYVQEGQEGEQEEGVGGAPRREALSPSAKDFILAVAINSPMPDWQAKLAEHAARSGNTAALVSLLPEALTGNAALHLLGMAAYSGHVHILDLLATRGLPSNGGNGSYLDGDLECTKQAEPSHVRCGARDSLADGGPGRCQAGLRRANLAAADWLVQVLGPEALGQHIAEIRVCNDVTLDMMKMLHGHGWLLSTHIFAVAAGSGSEEALEWLWVHGCPMGGDLSTLNFLRRLGCPGSDNAGIVGRALQTWCHLADGPRPIGVAWLLEQGFPWDGVDGSDRTAPDVLDWLREVHQRCNGRSGSGSRRGWQWCREAAAAMYGRAKELVAVLGRWVAWR
ncbi:hypothetical protein PLESTM_000626300 [Pleodorina starrii]|nr:hypothetical protein PLESTM_000626300 [Pleodorina starrii]